MTPRCTELDMFFDGELDADQVAAFHDHLATCERCQRVLLGRMQEAITADAAADALDREIADAGASGAAPAAEAADEADPGDAPSARAAHAAELAPEVPAPASDPARGSQGRRILAYAAPVLAAAAALPLLCRHPHDADAPLELTCEIEHGPTRARGAVVGDTLHPKMHGARHRAIAVYLDGDDLRAACPSSERCRDAGDTMELWFTLKEPGVYTVVALDADHEIPRPPRGSTLDEFLARHPGIRSRRETVRVDD